MAEEIKDNTPVIPYKLFDIDSNDKRSYIFEGKVINLELGVPENCVELYKKYKSFPFLKLKKGAHVLFEDLGEQELISLILTIKRISDINILKKLIKSPDLLKQVTSYIKELK